MKPVDRNVLYYLIAIYMKHSETWREYFTVEQYHIVQLHLGKFSSFCSWINKVEHGAPEGETPFTIEQMLRFRLLHVLQEQFFPIACVNYPQKWVRISWYLILQEYETLLKKLKEEEDQVTDLDSMLNMTSLFRNTVFEPYQELNIVDDMYYTLEDDAKDCESEIKKMQLREEEAESVKAINFRFGIMNDDREKLGKSSASSKYLIAEIDRLTSGRKNRNLKALLMESKPSVSKWANEDRVGQEELYDACENVLSELKAYTEHSYPFLTKVSKRDVPDYYDVIKNPMDLGTIARKIKSFSYNSKEEFINDLYLIYDNCFLYNTAPDSIYRLHAVKMREKTNALIGYIPNITIKKKEGILDEDLSEMVFTDEDDGNDKTFDDDESDIEIVQVDTAKYEDDNDDELEVEEVQQSTIPLTIESPLRLDDERFVDLQYLRYKQTTGNARIEFLISRHNLVNDFQNQCALIRSKESMNRFIDSFFGLFHESGRDGNVKQERISASSTSPFLPELFHFCSSIPESIALNNNSSINIPIILDEYKIHSLFNEDTPELSKYAYCKLPTGIYRSMLENVRHLNQIRKVKSKLDSLEDYDTEERYEQDTEEVIPYAFEGESGPLDVSVHDMNLNSEVVHGLLEKHLVLFLYQCGYESALQATLDMFKDLYESFLVRLGSTLRLYMDHYSHTMNLSEMVDLSLKENGGMSYKSLSDFLLGNKHYTRQLADIRRRIEMKYKHEVSGVQSEQSDGDFSEEDAAFTTGDFGDDIGLDYLGFKELGITSVHLSGELALPGKKSRFVRKRKRSNDIAKVETLKYQVPILKPISSNVADHIGLLQGYFKLKLSKSSVLVDEQVEMPKVEKKAYKKAPPINTKS